MLDAGRDETRAGRQQNDAVGLSAGHESDTSRKCIDEDRRSESPTNDDRGDDEGDGVGGDRDDRDGRGTPRQQKPR